MPHTEPNPTPSSRDDRRAALDSLAIDRGAARPRRRRRLPRWLVWLLWLAVIGGAVVGFRAATAVPTVRTATVLSTSPIAEHEITTANGYVVARTRASVASKTQGRLERMLVDEGDVVEAGQLIAVVEHDELDATVAEADAVLEKARRAVPAAEAALAQSEADVGAVQAALDERRASIVEAEAVLAQSELEFRRVEDLVQREIRSAADLDTAREARDVARARVELAKTTLATATATVERARAAVEVQRRQVDVVTQDVAAQEAARARAVANRDNAFIRAPFAGMVLRREAEPGEVVSPANTGASGSKTAVVTLADFATLEIEVDVYERDIARVTVDTPCRIVLDAYPKDRLPGRVRLLRPTADRTRATIQVYVAFAAIPTFARPEMGARVTFYEQDVDVLVADELSVVASAVTERGGARGVFVVSGRTLRFQRADFGDERVVDGIARRIVTGGLSVGDVVVAEPTAELEDGARVVVEGS